MSLDQDYPPIPALHSLRSTARDSSSTPDTCISCHTWNSCRASEIPVWHLFSDVGAAYAVKDDRYACTCNCRTCTECAAVCRSSSRVSAGVCASCTFSGRACTRVAFRSCYPSGCFWCGVEDFVCGQFEIRTASSTGWWRWCSCSARDREHCRTVGKVDCSSCIGTEGDSRSPGSEVHNRGRSRAASWMFDRKARSRRLASHRLARKDLWTKRRWLRHIYTKTIFFTFWSQKSPRYSNSSTNTSSISVISSPSIPDGWPINIFFSVSSWIFCTSISARVWLV